MFSLNIDEVCLESLIIDKILLLYPMGRQKTVFLDCVVMFTITCALPAAIATGGILVIPSAFAQEVTCLGVTATIVGTSGNDVLPGTDGRDVIAGLGGNDEIQGLGGNDLICGNEGADRLSGGDGNDDIFGGDGSDIMTGGDGNDDIFGGNGNDNLDSRDGVVNNDNLDGGNGNNDTCLSDPDPEVNCELD